MKGRHRGGFLAAGDGHGSAVGLRHLVADERLLLRDKGAQGSSALFNAFEHPLVERGQHRAFHDLGQRIDDAAAQRRADDLLALDGQELAPLQLGNDRRAGGGGADAIALAQHLPVLRIGDELVDVFHGADQRALGEARWRLGPRVLAGGVRAGHGVTLSHRRQGLDDVFAVLVLAFLIGLVLLVVHITPTDTRDNLAARGEVLARDLHPDGGLHVLVQRVELRQVCAHDQVVDVALALAEGRLAALVHGRNDAVVCGDLRVVPSPGLDARICALDQPSQLGVHMRDRLQHARRVGMLRLRQEGAVGTRVRGQLVRLVERLAGVQHLLGAATMPGRCQGRDVGQGKSQRLVLLPGFLPVHGDGARLALDSGHQCVGHDGIDQAAFAVQPGLILPRLPGGGEAAAGVLHHGADLVVRLGLERLDLAVSGDHNRQGRRLHAAHGQQRARAATLGA